MVPWFPGQRWECQGHRVGRPALDSPALESNLGQGLFTSLLHLDHSNTILLDGPPTQHGVTPTPLLFPHSLKRIKSLCLNLVSKPSLKCPLFYHPLHHTLTSDLDSPPSGALCPCCFLKPYCPSPCFSA